MKDLKNELHILQALITQEFSGVLWITEGTLTKELPYYEALDYLVDGAIELLRQNEIHPENNLILGDSFGHPFFIAHFNSENKVPNLNSVLKTISSERAQLFPKVLLLGEIGLDIESKMKKENPHLQFEILVS